MKNTGGVKNVLWAVNAFDTDFSQVQVVTLLKTLARSTHATIEPVFVVTPSQTRVPPDYIPRWAETYRCFAEKELHGLIKQSELQLDLDEALLAKQVLIEESSSTRNAVNRLLEHAKNSNTDLIVVATHARKGAARFFLGSFAETLLLQSDIPVVTINPDTVAPKEITSILFPTDFGQPSRRSFEEVVEFAKSIDARLTLFYKEAPYFSSPLFIEPGVYASVERESQNREKLAEAWLSWARHRGVEVNAKLDREPGNVAQAIIEYAQELDTDLIAMVAQTGPVASVLLGSNTRHVVRGAHSPVWIKRALQ